MSSCQTTYRIIARKEVLERFNFVTITGKVEFEDVGKVTRIARAYAEVVKASIKRLAEGKDIEDIIKELRYILPNYVYLQTAVKQAKLILEGSKGKVKVKRFWLASRGSKFDKGNRNIKFHVTEDHVEVKVKNPWGGDWVYGKAWFGKEYLPLLKELEDLANRKEEGYSVVITFKEGTRIHVQIPLYLYLKHFSVRKTRGYGLVAGIDLNSDRLNVVVLDKSGRVITKKTWWYEDATRPGFSREKAKQLRLKALSDALRFLSRIGVDYVVFEDLFVIKARKFGKSKTGNRKISRFAKREMLTHGVIKSLRYCFTVLLVNPGGTTNSREHEEVMKTMGFDRHMASAYLIAKRGLEKLGDIN